MSLRAKPKRNFTVAARCSASMRPAMPKSISEKSPVVVDEHVAGVQVAVEDAVGDHVLERAGDGQVEQALAVDRVGVGRQRLGRRARPRTRVITNTSSAVRCGIGRGKIVKSWPAASEARASSTWFSASKRKSISSSTIWANSSTKPERLATRADFDARSAAAGGQGHGPQVALELLAQAGPADLDHDLGAVVERGGVDLADRRRAERLGVEVGENTASSGTSKRVLEELLGHARRQRRGRVAAPAEGVDPLVGQQALGGGDELAELDVGGAARLHQLLHVLHGRARLERALPHPALGVVAQARAPRPWPGRRRCGRRPAASAGRSDGRASSAASSATRARASGPQASHSRAWSRRPGCSANDVDASSTSIMSGSGGTGIGRPRERRREQGAGCPGR